MTEVPMTRVVVLVVEDEPVLRMMAVDMVEEAGFEAIEAANSAEAIQHLESSPGISLIFTDIEMPPGIDGVRLAEIARERWPRVGIILVSGQISRAKVTLPHRAMFFSKPFRQSDIVDAMIRLAA